MWVGKKEYLYTVVNYVFEDVGKVRSAVYKGTIATLVVLTANKSSCIWMIIRS